MQKVRKYFSARRLLAFFLKGLLGLVLLCLLTLTGVFLWLRTDSATRYIAETATGLLKEQGFVLEMSGISGPLPSELHIEGLRLADEQGTLFLAESVELSLRLRSLWERTLEISRLRLVGPELIRLPVLPPAEPSEDSSGGIPALPLDIVLGEFSLSKGKLHASALALAGQEQSDETQAADTDMALQSSVVPATDHPSRPTRLADLPQKNNGTDQHLAEHHETAPKPPHILDVEGTASASLKNARLAATAAASLMDQRGQGLSLDIRLETDELAPLSGQKAPSPPRTGGDQLFINLRAEEKENGPLSLLLARNDIPGYSLNLQGKGPLNNWHGTLTLLLAPLPDSGTGPPPLARTSTEILTAAEASLHGSLAITLRCAHGSFWRDLITEPAFNLETKAEASPGAVSPPSFFTFTGGELSAVAALTASGDTAKASLTLDSPALKATVKELRLAPYVPGQAPHLAKERTDDNAPPGKGKNIQADITAHFTPLAQGEAAGKPESATLPLESLSLEGHVDALTLASLSAASLQGTLTVRSNEENFTADYALEGGLEEKNLSVRKAQVQGLGILAALSGGMNLETEAASAKVSLQAEDKAPWQELLARLAGYQIREGEPLPLGGSLNLEAAVDLPALHGHAVSANARPKPDTRETTLSARPLPDEPDTTPAVLAVNAARPPASGSFQLTASNLRWPDEQLHALFGSEITATAHLSGGSGVPYMLRLERLTAGTVSASGFASLIPETSFEAKLEAALSTIAPLFAQTDRASGSISLQCNASGSFEAPELSVELNSPELRLPTGSFNGLNMRADAKTRFTDAETQGQGTLSLNFRNSPGGPIRLSSDWNVRLDKNAPTTPLSASLERFSLRGAGTEVTAALDALLATAESPESSPQAPSLKGRVDARVTDWAPLAALSAIPLSGLPATVALRFDNNAGRQAATLTASLPSLVLRDKDASAPSLSLREVAINARGTDLYTAPALNCTLNTGPGLAGPLRWRQGIGFVRGSGGRGEFSLALKQGGKNPQQTGSRDRLNVQGSYNLNTPEILVTTLTMNDFRSKTGLRLKSPMLITLTDGVQLRRTEIAFQPAGSLEAEAAFTPGNMQVRAKLDKLPFSVTALFSDAPLPDGVLAAEVDLRTAQGHPQGSFSLRSTINPTQGNSGVIITPATATDATGGKKTGEQQTGQNSLVFAIRGDLAPQPGPALFSGSGVRAAPGLIWLRGTGNFGSSRKPDETREGRLDFQLPLRPAGNGIPLPDTAAQFAATLHWNGLVETLWQAVPLADTSLSGPALFDIGLHGTLASPKPRIEAFLGGASFRDVPNGILIRGMDLEARSTADGLRALLAASDAASGSLAAELTLEGLNSGAGPSLNLRGQLNNFSPLHRDDLKISLSGIFGAKGPVDSAALTGDIVVQEGELLLSGNFGTSIPVLDITHRREGDSGLPAAENDLENDDATAASGPTLDIRIRVPREFFIRGSGLDSEWQGELHVTGKASKPALVGSLRPVRGYFEFLSRTFRFTGGSIQFFGGQTINPTLSLELTYEGPSITAVLRTSGTAQNPGLSLESTPSLPQDEILAHVLFGKRTSDLSRFEAIQLANSMIQLTGGGSLTPDVLTGLRRQTGLDMLRIGSSRGSDQRSTSGQSGEGNLGAPSADADNSGAGSPTLEAGKYINDSIYVGVEQGFEDDSTAVRVEVELFPSISLEGKSSATSSSVGLGWKMDF